jgi:hypothetical protein
MPRFRYRHAFVALTLLLAMVSQGTWALAGTTGSITGYVRDQAGAPVSDAAVTASSLSQVATVHTDSTGHFDFLSLAPDTYTLAAAKDGYQDTSLSGISVFADQVQTVSLTMPKQLKTIASVRSQAASSLVKSGVGGDIYSVDPAQIQKTATLGGGGNLDSAYSAIASVPGLVVGTGQAGWGQSVVIRGNASYFTGFEYDGIPVNRAFDNYNSSVESNLGLQELQVYTGGGPSSISSTGTSGFINQVIKTGTYPGYGTLQGGLSAYGAYYHSARAEAGGATPDRTFSYYVGISGYDQAFHQIDNNNGASYFYPGSPYQNYGFISNGIFTALGLGVFNDCTSTGLDATINGGPPQGCLSYMPTTYGDTNLIQDREDVANFHFAIPRANGQRDDVQLLWSASALKQYFLTNFGNEPGNLDQTMIAMTGFPYCGPSGTDPGCAATQDAYNNGFFPLIYNTPASASQPWENYPYYMDSYEYNLPFGTNVEPNGTPLQPGQYFQSNTPAHAFQGPLPLGANTLNDLNNNDTGIVKLQWTHPFDSRSFLRLMGYSFFSDWTEDGANSGYGASSGWEDLSPNYDLITHTAGGMLQYFNQLNDKNLLQFTGNYTHANVGRFNHVGGGSTGTGSTPLGLISLDSSGNYHCWSASSGSEVPCYSSSYKSSAGAVAATGTLPAITGNAATSGAYWATLQNGNASGTYNSVIPNFYSASLDDQWRPTEKLTIDAAVRFDQFSYNLAPADVAQNPFYAQIVQNYACVDPSTNTVEVNPLLPGQYPPANPVFTNGPCNSGFVHPDGIGGDPLFSLNVPSTYTLKYWEPRLSGTFTENPDTVWRFSVGRYAEPPLSAAVEYLYRGGSGTNLWTNFLALGTYSPFHPITAQTSGQYDFSLEKHLHGTPWSFKITPFYSTTSNWEEQSFIGAGFVTQIPVGKARSWGVETALNFGDFNREGLSGMATFTWTRSQVQFQNLLGANQIADMNTAIQNYNALTQAGGGSPCYNGGVGEACPAAGTQTGSDILNPYYTASPQPLMDTNGWYDQGVLALKPGVYTGNPGFFNSPYVTNLVVNYRHQKFAITPSVQFQSGTRYGTPYDVYGVDPRDCGSNQGPTGTDVATTNNPLTCDYLTAGPGAAPNFTYLYVPNPQTGKFASLGQFTEPTIMIANLQASYDISPRISLQLTATDLYHTCFGGTKDPWTAANPVGKNNCGYYASGLYNGAGWYNGASPTDSAANGGVTPYAFEEQSYLPKFNNSQGGFIPFTLYLQAQIKL